jgi:hypothetical protein
VSAAIKTANPGAVSEDTEIESFFDTAADAQVLLDERFNWRSVGGRPFEQIEFDTSLGLGTLIAITPAAPTVTISDAKRNINAVVCKVRGYAIDFSTERFAVEIVG